MTDLNKEREAFAQTEFNTFGLDVKDFKTTGEYFMFIGWLMRLELEKAKAQAVPEGYALVPKEPTEKMANAFDIGMLESEHFFGEFDAFQDAYTAMIKAAGDQNEKN
ncbi:hypothetical protein ACKERC_02745 [Acinetobacter baumannii]|uniref:hypothetical protein n=1 Tax=Acinetobacter baumannii TaxID=470 RepID=UPI0038B515CF